MVKEEIKAQREKLKGADARAKLQYFWDYYKIHAFVFLAVFLVIIYLISTFQSRKEQVLGAIFLNAKVTEEDAASRMEEEFAEFAGIDTAQYEINLNLALFQSAGGYTGSTIDMAAQANIDVQVESGDLDVLITNPSNYQYYVNLGNFIDVRDVLTEEQQKRYESDYYYIDLTELKKLQEAVQNLDYEVLEAQADSAESADADSSEDSYAITEDVHYERPDPEQMDDPVPVGIFVTDASYLVENEIYGGNEAVFGFPQNSEHRDEAVQFLNFLTR